MHPHPRPRVGLLGGTFDPVHHGHLFLALEARHACQLDHVLFVPNKIPPHKATPGSSAEHRLAMLMLAVRENPYFKVSRFELDRPDDTPSYSVHTINALGKQAKLTFISGHDTFNTPWYCLKEAVDGLDTLLLAHRDEESPELPSSLKELPPHLRAKIQQLPLPRLALSSTMIRARIRSRRPFRYLVPDPVYHFIKDHQLYLSPSSRKGADLLGEKG